MPIGLRCDGWGIRNGRWRETTTMMVPFKKPLGTPKSRIENPIRMVQEHGLDEARAIAIAAGATKQDLRTLEMASRTLSEEEQSASFIYSAFSMTSLPHRKPEDEFAPWERTSSVVSLTVRAGPDPYFSGIMEQRPPDFRSPERP
jgi:hypothetical protein